MACESAPAGPGAGRDRPTRGPIEAACGVSVPPERERPTPRPVAVGWGVFIAAGWPDRAIAEIAARQRALIARPQLTELGLGASAIEHALARGRLHRIHRGVYALVASPALPALAYEHAAILACGEGALLSHHSAAAVWGIRPFRDGEVDITVIATDRGRRRKRIRVHPIKTLHPRDRRRYQQLPLTSPARVLLELAPHISARSLEWAHDQAIVKRLTSHTAIRAVPEVNARVGNYTADFRWRAEKVILEIDGYHYHHTRTRFERDHQRDTEHQLQDFLVIRRTPRQLEQNLDALLVPLATLLERRRRPAA